MINEKIRSGVENLIKAERRCRKLESIRNATGNEVKTTIMPEIESKNPTVSLRLFVFPRIWYVYWSKIGPPIDIEDAITNSNWIFRVKSTFFCAVSFVRSDTDVG